MPYADHIPLCESAEIMASAATDALGDARQIPTFGKLLDVNDH